MSTHTHWHYAPLIGLNMARTEYTLNDMRFVSGAEWYTNIYERTHAHLHYALLIIFNMARTEYTLDDMQFVSGVVHYYS